MLEMRVRGLCRCSQHPVPSIVLEDAASERLLAIGVPPGEAERIAHEIGRRPVCDPSIFTAFVEALRFLGAGGLTPWLNLEGQEVIGLIGLGLPGRETVIRCAPRDVAVLAAVARMPVRIGDALARAIEAVQPDAEPCGEECRQNVAQWLDRVRPGDFA